MLRLGTESTNKGLIEANKSAIIYLMSNNLELATIHDETEALGWPSAMPWVLGADTKPYIKAETLPFDGVVLVDSAYPEDELRFTLAHERVHVQIGGNIRAQLITAEDTTTIRAYQDGLWQRGISRVILANICQTDQLGEHYKDDIQSWHDKSAMTLDGIRQYTQMYFAGIRSGKVRHARRANELDIAQLRYRDIPGITYRQINPETESDLFLSAVRTGCHIATMAIDRMCDGLAPGRRLLVAEEALANWVAARRLGLTIDDVEKFGGQDEYKLAAAKQLERRWTTADPMEVLSEVTDYTQLMRITDQI